MFFDVKGIRWTLLAIAGVVLLCVIDLRCSFSRDREAAGGAQNPAGGVVSRVQGELAAGRRELATLREDQIIEQLRDLRVIAKRLVKAGRTRDARRVFAAIQELEEARSRIRARADAP